MFLVVEAEKVKKRRMKSKSKAEGRIQSRGQGCTLGAPSSPGHIPVWPQTQNTLWTGLKDEIWGRFQPPHWTGCIWNKTRFLFLKPLFFDGKCEFHHSETCSEFLIILPNDCLWKKQRDNWKSTQRSCFDISRNVPFQFLCQAFP